MRQRMKTLQVEYVRPPINIIVKALQRRQIFVDQTQVYCTIQSVPRYAFFPGGTNEGMALVPSDGCRRVAKREVTRPAAPGFRVTSGSESEDTRPLGKHVGCNRASRAEEV